MKYYIHVNQHKMMTELDYKKLARERYNLLARARGYFAMLLTDPDICRATKVVAKQALEEIAENKA